MTLAEQAHPGSENGHGGNPHDATIVVNGDNVTLPIGKYNGLQIKEAAISQGVTDIAPNFVLSVQHGNHYQVVGDQDVIEIHDGLDFVAVTGDDNS